MTLTGTHPLYRVNRWSNSFGMDVLVVLVVRIRNQDGTQS